MERKKMHHVGIVLPTEETVYAFMQQYGLEVDKIEETPYQSKAIFTKAGPNECPIEFLIPSGGPLAAFNGGKGGIHHICYEVEDMAASMAQLRAQGCQMLEEEPLDASKPGSQDFGTVHLNFVRPKSSFGVLVELWEEKPAAE